MATHRIHVDHDAPRIPMQHAAPTNERTSAVTTSPRTSQAPPTRMSHGVKIVIGLLLLVVLMITGLAYAFFKLAGP